MRSAEQPIAVEVPQTKERKRVMHPCDAAAKQLLACRPILAFVLKNTIAELADCTIKEIEHDLIEGDVSMGDAPVHTRDARSPLAAGLCNEGGPLDGGTISYDMLLRVRLPGGDGLVGVIVNLESQLYETDYPVLRHAIYYCARLLLAQRGWGRISSDCRALKKVYSIWLFTGSEAAGEGGITTYGFTERHQCGSWEHDPADYDLVEVVFVHVPQPGGCNGFLEKLATLFSLETGRDEKLRALEDELTWDLDEGEELVARLMSMGEYAVEYGVAKGLARGREEAALENVRALMASMTWDAEQAMGALAIDAELRRHYRELLAQSDTG